MLKPQGYCKGCRDRTAEDPDTGARDCHRTCEKYKQFKRELAAWYADYYKQRKLDHVATDRPWLVKNKGVKND